MPDVTEIESRRAQRKAAAEEARKEQYAKDLEAIDALEVESGDEITTLKVASYKAGLPTLVGIKAPSETYYKRYAQMIRRAGQNLEKAAEAQEMLAESCWVYPADKQARKAMREAFPAVLMSIVVKVNELVELKSEEEGKG
jgi:hypothetical protein